MTLIKMSFYGAVLILAILLIRTFTLHKLPKKTFLILWGVALLRLLIPFEIASGFSLYSLLPESIGISESTNYLEEHGAMEIADGNTMIVKPNADEAVYLPTENLDVEAIPLPTGTPDTEAIPLPYTAPNTQPIREYKITINTPSDTGTNRLEHIIPLLPILWGIGTLLCAAWFLISYIRCYREFCTSLPVTEKYAAEWLKKHPLRRAISIRQSDKISAPLTYGIFRPVILLPKKTDWENTTQLDYVLYHEFTHIRRFDLAAKLVMIVALCLHWFNPFVWLMYFFFNRDIELSCDDCVVKHFGEAKSAYANTLIGMEEKKNYSTPLCNHFSKNAIEERITAIMKSKKTTIGMIVAAIIIVVVVIVTLTTSGQETTEPSEDFGSTPQPTVNTTPTPTTPPDNQNAIYDELLMYPPRTSPDWYAAVEQIEQGMTPANTTILPNDTEIPDYAIDALHAQAESYLAECGLGIDHSAKCYAVCQTGDITVYSANISAPYDNAPNYFTIYHAYNGEELVGKVIKRSLITFYDAENLSHVWAMYIYMDDVVQMAKEQLEAFYASKQYNQPYEITSIHMISDDTIRVEFLIPESNNFEIYTEAVVEFTHDFTTETWSASYFRETPPDYLSSYADFPRLAPEEVTVSGKDWCLTFLDETELPRFQELMSAGGTLVTELIDSRFPEEGSEYTIYLDGIGYYFYSDSAPENNHQAWNIYITSPDYPLSGGASVGMTAEELLALYPALAKTNLTYDDPVFEANYGPSMFNFRDDQFPESFLKEYDYAYTAYLDKGRDGLPVCIAFLIKNNQVGAITVYMPTAG